MHVELEYLATFKGKVPRLDPCKMIQYLADSDHVGCLHGGNDLNQFWRRFSIAQPNHWVFQAARDGSLLLSRTLPKKRAILLWSMRGCFGNGTQHFQAGHGMEAQAGRMGLNMQESFRSRLLHVAIPRSYYTKGKDAWDRIGRCIGEAYKHGMLFAEA